MSIQAVAWALEQWIESPGAKLVLVAVANYADKSGEGWPALGRLVEETCMTRRTIQRHLDALVEMGLVVKTARHEDNGRQTTNLYRIDTAVHVRREAADGEAGAAGDAVPTVENDAETTPPEGGEGVKITPSGVSPVTRGRVSPVTPSLR